MLTELFAMVTSGVYCIGSLCKLSCSLVTNDVVTLNNIFILIGLKIISANFAFYDCKSKAFKFISLKGADTYSIPMEEHIIT